MTNPITYEIYRAKISIERMQFNILNRQPIYPTAERQAAKTEIEKQLFAVFCKYA